MWKGYICVHEHAPTGLFSACAVHVKAIGGRERRKQQTTNQNHATFWQCCTFGGSCETWAARIVSKELQVILKVTMNFFQGSKWIQSLQHVGLLPEDVVQVHLFHFELCWIFYLERYVTIVSGWRVSASVCEGRITNGCLAQGERKRRLVVASS